MFHYRKIESLDAAENVFFQRQLEEIAAESFDVKYAELKGRKFLPTKQLAAGAETYTYRQYDWRAKPAPMIDMADDLPLANTKGTEFSFSLRSFGLAFSYSLDEIQAAMKGGRPLERERAYATRQGLAQYLDDVCATGDSTFGLKGLLNIASTATYTVPADGTGSSKLWTTKTPDQILRDMNGMISQVITDTKEVESPKRLVLPTAALQYISNTARSSTSDTTILEFFKGTRTDVEVVGWERNSAAGGSSDGRMVAYDPKLQNLHLLMSIEYEQLAPQQKNFVYVVNARLKTGGVVAPYPKSVIYGDGITPA